jgi:two-component system, NtrC family, response regulator AtoC
VDAVAEILGNSAVIVKLREQIRQILKTAGAARRPAPILIHGETGTGKGLIAHVLQRGSPRASDPFVDVNCAAIPEHLLEAELFGYERGAFTDARHSKPGLFQLAHRGTLFLDEIALLPEGLQAKLLKVLDDGAIRRLGATTAEMVDVWIVAATNEDLDAARRAHRLREDLYHRLAVLTIDVPALRTRGDDVIQLAEHFMARACADYGLTSRTLALDARAALLAYRWPGNVRELSNILERAALLSDEPVVTAATLALPVPDRVVNAEGPAAASSSAPRSSRDRMRAHLLEVLIDTGWNITRTAAILGVARNTVTARIARFGLARGDGARPALPDVRVVGHDLHDLANFLKLALL